MRGAFLALAFIVIIAVLLVMAFVFRNERARNALLFMRRAAWLYIAAIVALAAWQIYTRGF